MLDCVASNPRQQHDLLHQSVDIAYPVAVGFAGTYDAYNAGLPEVGHGTTRLKRGNSATVFG